MRKRIDDIAREAGVSTATVSRVINTPNLVAETTRRKVEEIIERLGYKPNIFARGLMNSKTNSVGILVPFITNPYFMALVDALESTLAPKDTFCYLCNIRDSERLEREYAEELIRRNVDALIVVENTSFNRPGGYFLNLDAGRPVILVNEHMNTDTRHHIIRCSQEPGLLEAFGFFHSKNLLPIAFVAGDTAYSFSMKEDLLRRFADEHGIDPGYIRVHHLLNPNAEDIVQRAARFTVELLSEKGPPRAILAGNDMIAVGVLQGAVSLGLSIPRDLSIIGVDNTLLSRISRPLLSTVDLRMEELGRMAAELYIAVMDGNAPSSPVRSTIRGRLIHRETT